MQHAGKHSCAVIISGFSYGHSELDRALAWGYVPRNASERHHLLPDELDELLTAIYFDNTTTPLDSLRVMRCGVHLEALLQTACKQPTSLSPAQIEYANKLLEILTEYTQAFSNFYSNGNDMEMTDESMQPSAIEEWLTYYSSLDAEKEFLAENLKLLSPFEQPQFSAIGATIP